MSIFDARTARSLATILLCLLVLGFVYLAWRTLVTFLFAILFAYLLEPAVTGIQNRLRLTRGLAVAVLYFLLVLGLGIALFLIGQRVVQQAAHLSELSTSLTSGIGSGKLVQEIGNTRGWSGETQARLQHFLVQHRDAIAHWEQSAINDITNLASNAGWVALIPILAIFFLMGGHRFLQLALDQVARRRQRAFVAHMLQDIHEVLANYIRAQILLTAIALVVYVVGLELLRLRFAVAVGVIGGLLEFIPVLGPLLGAVVVVVTGFVTGYSRIWALVLFLGAWRMVQDYVNSPRIMGNQVQLDPLAVLFGAFAGAEIAGVIGVYLSIPVMATLRVIWLRWRSFHDGARIVAPAPGDLLPSDITPPAAPQ